MACRGWAGSILVGFARRVAADVVIRIRFGTAVVLDRLLAGIHFSAKKPMR